MKTLPLTLAAVMTIGLGLGLASPALADAAPAAAVKNGVRLVVPTRNIARGDIIADSDLSYDTVPASQAFGGAAAAIDQLAGKQARRFLRVGQPVRASDVRAPILVTKGSTVTMTFKAPGISLTAVGKAMSEGGKGEMVTVLNPVSYRQITATVTGPGTVSAGDISNTVTADAAPAQVATIQN